MYLRDHFPIFKEKVYLNSCSQGALSFEVMNAYKRYLNDWQEKGSPWELWVERNETVRHGVAGLLNSDPNEIAVTTSVSAAVGSLATALDFSGERNKIIVDDFAFPTTAQIWHANEARGAQVVHVPAAGSSIPLEYYEDIIDEKTLLVSLTHVCYRNGVKQDVKKIVEIAKRKGAMVLLDSFQAVGTMPIDVRELDVDFLTGGVLKYLCASAGLAFLYVRQGLINRFSPTDTGWFAQANIFAMDIYRHDPSPTARRFESGTPPVPNTYAAQAGLQLVRQVGLAKIEDHLREITGAIKAGAMKRGFNLVTPVDPQKHGAMVAIRSHKVDLLVKWLEKDGIIVSSRDDNLRISPHFYNNFADVDKLLDCLTTHKELMV
ncbi:MAG: aminotransferase class V-fold PLP-dependent enzyme [Ardenticatenaceae bacterium]|nr:aminotransferase class V-fold PLP-dependent enzyme [Ardenticatenaceae bacterium]